MHARFWADFFQGLTPVLIFSLGQGNLSLQKQTIIALRLRQMLLRQQPAGIRGSLLQIWWAAMEIALGEQIKNLSPGSRVLSKGFFQYWNTRWKAATMMERPTEQEQPLLFMPRWKTSDARFF